MNEVIAFSAEALKSVAEAEGAQYAFLRWLYYPIFMNSGILLTVSIYVGLGILILIASFSLFMNVEVRECEGAEYNEEAEAQKVAELKEQLEKLGSVHVGAV